MGKERFDWQHPENTQILVGALEKKENARLWLCKTAHAHHMVASLYLFHLHSWRMQVHMISPTAFYFFFGTVARLHL